MVSVSQSRVARESVMAASSTALPLDPQLDAGSEAAQRPPLSSPSASPPPARLSPGRAANRRPRS